MGLEIGDAVCSKLILIVESITTYIHKSRYSLEYILFTKGKVSNNLFLLIFPSAEKGDFNDWQKLYKWGPVGEGEYVYSHPRPS